MQRRILFYAENRGATETEVAIIKEKQKRFFNNGFKTFLRESAEEDPTFLVKFVECATGSNYLPYDKTFKINVEFDFSLEATAYPVFHSCTHDIRLPGYEAFFAHYPKFKSDMKTIIDDIYNKFDMT